MKRWVTWRLKRAKRRSDALLADAGYGARQGKRDAALSHDGEFASHFHNAGARLSQVVLAKLALLRLGAGK